MGSIDKHVGGKIRERRIMLCLSIQSLADELGCTPEELSNYEAGNARVGISVLAKLSCILNVRAQYFFEGVTDAAQPSDADYASNVIDFVSKRAKRSKC